MLIKFAEVAQKYNGTLKITSGQRIAILGLEPEDVEKAWSDIGLEPGVVNTYSVKTLKCALLAFVSAQSKTH